MRNERYLALGLSVAFVFASNLVGAEPLKAGIEHVERVAPVNPRLLPGQIFDERNLPPLGTTTGWYRIPNWYAGNWHRETQVISGFFGLVKTASKSSRNERRGYQRDALGGVWDYRDEPALDPVDLGSSIDLKFVQVREPIAITGKAVTIRYLATAVLVDKLTRQILRTCQEEDIHTWYPVSASSLRCDASQKFFDVSGLPLGNQRGYFYEQMIQPYAPVDYFNGKDLKADFKLYLQSHGMANRIP